MTAFLPLLNKIDSLRFFLAVVQDFIGRTKARISMWGMPL